MSRYAAVLALCAAAGVFTAAQEKPAGKPAPDAKKGLPLKAERKIEFTTDEGTWISLDVSPDGKTILFELAGDLYTVPFSGGKAVNIMPGMAFDSQPRYSPDGKRIAFLSDREGAENLWIANADGSAPKQLSKLSQGRLVSPAWTPDGDYVLVGSAPAGLGSPELWLYHTAGGAGVQVTKSRPTLTTPRDQRLHFAGPIASPDGKYFYYSRRRGSFSYNVTFPLWQIYRRDRTTGDEDALTNSVGSAFRPALSPDGKLLVYATRFETQTGLRLRDLATGEERWLKYPVQRDDQESRATRDVYPGFAFTPDGSELVVSFGGKIHALNIARNSDRVIPFEAEIRQDLGFQLKFAERVEQGPVKARLIQQPSLSPDGKQLAFSALTRLYSMTVPGGAPRELVSDGTRQYQPAWSPDGNWIAYVTWSQAGGHIWKVPASGQGAPVQLTRTPAYYRDPVWSPSGDRIVALRSARQARVETAEEFGAPVGRDVVWIPASGGEAALVVPARGVGRPHFSGDPDRIFVYSADGLISFRFDGTDRRTHLKVVGKSTGDDPDPAAEVRMNPKGGTAIALVTNQLYVMPVPQAGGEAPTVNVSTPAVPVKKLSDVGADYIGWADGGKTITWAVGATFFRQSLDTVVYEPEKKPEGEAAKEEKPAPKKTLYEEISVRVERPRAAPSGTIVLRGARTITMKGDEVIADADIVITGNRIAAVGKRGSVGIPAGAKIQDVKGSTVIPGIVDAHAHWTEVRRGVLDLQAWPYLANLAFGVTTGRDPQTFSNDAFAYQDLIDTGDILGPRAYSTGPGIFGNQDFQSLDDAKNIVSRYRKYYRTNTLKSYNVGNRKQRQWMVEACRENQIMPTTEGALDYKLDFTHAIDGFSGNEHALPIVPIYKDGIEIFARSGIYYTPTLLVAYGGPWAENYFYETTEVYGDPKLRRFIPQNVLYEKASRRPWFREDEHVFTKLATEAAKIVRAGGRVQIGGHGQLQGIQCHWEMWALQSGGLTPHEVLRAATLHGAEAIGFDQDLGSIEPGKLADLVILSKDPLASIRNTAAIRYVMKNGELFEGETLNQIWPKQKPLDPLWWWKEAPGKGAN